MERTPIAGEGVEGGTTASTDFTSAGAGSRCCSLFSSGAAPRSSKAKLICVSGFLRIVSCKDNKGNAFHLFKVTVWKTGV
jgi:hypothetical protein